MAVVNPAFSISDPGWTMLTNSAPATAVTGPSLSSQFAEGMLVAAPIMAIMGAINSAVGSYYQAESQKNALQVQAQNQRFAAEIGRINQRFAETSTRVTQLAGERRFADYSMRAGQQRAGARAAMAGRGIVLGEGSAAEIIGSMDVIKEIDRLTISAASIREQEAGRLQAMNIGTQALMSSLSAQNLQTTAGTIYPGLALGTSLLGSAADIGGTWARNRRIEELLAGVSTQRI